MLVLDKQVAANTLIHSSEVTLIDWELAEQLFWLSESYGSLTGTLKNNIFSAGLDMHADIMQPVFDIIILKFTILRLL